MICMGCGREKSVVGKLENVFRLELHQFIDEELVSEIFLCHSCGQRVLSHFHLFIKK